MYLDERQGTVPCLSKTKTFDVCSDIHFHLRYSFESSKQACF